MGKRILGFLLLPALLWGCGSGSPTSATENPLGVLVECDQVIENVVGYDADGSIVERRKVAYVPVEDPLSARTTRCGYYYGTDGELAELGGSISGAECDVSSDVTFTPNLEVYIECEKEEIYADGRTETDGYESAYLRADPKQTTQSSESPLGVLVECDEVIEETLERYNADYSIVEIVERRKVAYVPVEDPTSVTITRCSERYVFNDVTTVSRADCVASTEVESTPDSRVVVECEEETTYPVGYPPVNGGRGGVAVSGYEHVYMRVNPEDASQAAENPLGVPVECDDMLEWEFSPGTVHATQHRLSVAYLPVADPTSVTITRCGEYKITRNESTYSDACVSSKAVSFTEDFEVYVRCEEERTGWSSDTTGYERIYYRVD